LNRHKSIFKPEQMQENKYSIKHWAKDDRPREKLLVTGAENLSNTELLAVLLQNGSGRKSVIELAREVLLRGKNNLVELGKLSMADLMKVKGIGQAKALTLMAALELGRRRQAHAALDKTGISSSRDIALFFQNTLKDFRREVFAVIFLNRANKINHFEVIHTGGITSTVADPRVILRKALEQDAVSIVLCHNHPSGNLEPSRADHDLTIKIKNAAALLDIHVMDHIIVSDAGYFSFADAGVL
jgi:DNA repair protein RadC